MTVERDIFLSHRYWHDKQSIFLSTFKLLHCFCGGSQQCLTRGLLKPFLAVNLSTFPFLCTVFFHLTEKILMLSSEVWCIIPLCKIRNFKSHQIILAQVHQPVTSKGITSLEFVDIKPQYYSINLYYTGKYE